MLDVINGTESISESINSEMLMVDVQIESLQEYRSKLRKMLDVMHTETPAEPKIARGNRKTKAEVVEGRNILDSALNIIKNRDAVNMSWLVRKLEPKLARPGEDYDKFYKTVHASLTGNARRKNARIRIAGKGMVAAK